MELLLSEHGETLLYAIVGTIVIVMICSICCENWRKITPDYKNTLSRNSAEFIEQNKGKYPTIEVDEVIYTDYQNKEFNFRDYITAKDCDGNDITKDMNVYGDVNISKKGIYKLRCVVVAKNQLVCTKYVNIIVE